MTRAQLTALMYVMDGTVDVVRVAGIHGVPGGVLYAALMEFGCTLDQFQMLMNCLVKLDQVTRRGDLYYIA